MRTTLNIEDELLNKAAKLTGIERKNIPGQARSRSLDSEGKR